MEKQFHILDQINTPVDLKKLTLAELEHLVKDIRRFIIQVLSTNPGHFGASMGVVELTVALHYLVETPANDLIWDVGHQAYAHKILTERKADFANIRKFNHLSGFPKRSESVYDAFGTGHSSTSISAALGMAIANQLDGNNQCSIAIIGDGALTGGMAFEALNHLGTSQANVLVIINDNDNSIDDNVGALQHHLNSINSSNNFFTQLNLPYSGPIDGHNLPLLLSELKNTLALKGPRVLHIKTQKGKGYLYSEQGNVTHWHAPGKFNVETGYSIVSTEKFPQTYQQIVGETIVNIATNNSNVVVVTPAMASGSNLMHFKSHFPNRFVDVGIAEQHAVTLSAGLATKGKKVFCVIYSTFLQRGYDQFIHDVALQNLPVVFLIDRAGLVGNDGATHHGAFDLAYLQCIPNLQVLVPSNELQLAEMMHFAAQYTKGPIAIRYPRGKGMLNEKVVVSNQPITFEGIEIYKGKKMALLNIGSLYHYVEKAANELRNQGFDIGLYDLQCAKPLNDAFLTTVFENYQTVITVEDGVITGGIGSSITQWKSNKEYAVKTVNWGLPDQFIEHGSQEELYASVGLDVEGLVNRIMNLLR